MKILQFCNKPPFPPADGGAIAMGSMTRCLVHNGFEVTVLSMVSHKHRSQADDWPQDLRKRVRLLFAEVDLRVKKHAAFLNLFSSESYHAQRFHTATVARSLQALLHDEVFDVIQMETIYPMVYHALIRRLSDAPITLRLHNIEHEVWLTTAANDPVFYRRMYLRLLAERLKTFELKAISQAEGILAISSADLDKISHLIQVPAETIPLGMDITHYAPAMDFAHPPRLFHLGAMDWIPNQIGLRWFLDKVWPRLRARFPALELHLAGRKMPAAFFGYKSPGLIIHGEVGDAVEFMRSKDIMIVPLLSGSGLRVKIIEGMLLGKVVVSTSVGASGIHYKDGENILIANNEDEFVRKISDCINRPDFLKHIGRNACSIAREEYALERVSMRLGKFYERLTGGCNEVRATV
ncbi:MAG: glycosyl transferase family 1 [Chitinophagales bacterium]|nr:MAG: glycosyl transferase family 1 [Chitinophagales bacterium]